MRGVRALLAAGVLLLISAIAADSGLPPYRSSGKISGTSLLYENLYIDKQGNVAITITNPERTGEKFAANFSFYTDKGVYLTGFALEGFAGRVSRTSYELKMENYAKLKRAAYMKVLGRSGRLSD